MSAGALIERNFTIQSNNTKTIGSPSSIELTDSEKNLDDLGIAGRANLSAAATPDALGTPAVHPVTLTCTMTLHLACSCHLDPFL